MVITDMDPYDLPLGAWSFASNVRFHNGRVARGPVFRRGIEAPGSEPRFVFAVSGGATGQDSIYIGRLNGRVDQWSGTGLQDQAPTGFSSSVEGVWSGCTPWFRNLP